MSIDLSKLIPQDEECIFSDKTGKNHTFKLFVPYSLGLAQDEASKNDDLTGYQMQLIALESVLKHQFPMMDADWIADNIALPQQNAIYAMIMTKINEGTEALAKIVTKGKKKHFFSRSGS